MTARENCSPSPNLSQVLVALMKGVAYRDDDPARWQSLIELQARVREYVSVIGLELTLDEAEGYAYLRQRVAAPGEAELPHLVPRRQLGYSVSVLLSLLRKRLAEFDAMSGDTRLILSREDLFDLVRLFLRESGNEARQMDRVESDIKKIVDMGFLYRLNGQEDKFEVRRILKSFVDAQWLGEFSMKLAEYRACLRGNDSDEGKSDDAN